MRALWLVALLGSCSRKDDGSVASAPPPPPPPQLSPAEHGKALCVELATKPAPERLAAIRNEIEDLKLSYDPSDMNASMGGYDMAEAYARGNASDDCDTLAEKLIRVEGRIMGIRSSAGGMNQPDHLQNQRARIFYYTALHERLDPKR